ncbi:MAG: SPOR domain-containing protein [Muribaculaceae bacterium]|nr:SPOR domain-containing protein [Muribaculaceae bacterium]
MKSGMITITHHLHGYLTLIIGLLLSGLCILPGHAQTNENVIETPEEERVTLSEMIEESSNGNVEIIISSDLLEKILEAPHGRPKQKRNAGPRIKEGLNKLRGFRIQVFNDGRNQSTLETKARSRGSAIAAKFPKYRGQVYTYSSAPNWITRVGNFRTSAEAQAALQELKSAFPQFAGEMRIVNSDIYVIR